MVEVNWSLLTYLLIGLFALAGLYKGWWKEAITTIFLTVLVFLLLFPAIAATLIETINFVIFSVWGLLSESYQISVSGFLEAGLGIETTNGPPRIEPGDPQTWLIILIIFLGLAILISRLSLPNFGQLSFPYYGYPATWGGSFLGGVLGGINGWLIISLVRAYLDGRSLPGGQGVGAATRDVVIQAVEVPRATITDSFLPWFFIILAIFIFIVAVRSRVVILQEKGFRKIDYRSPLGYKKIDIVVKRG